MTDFESRHKGTAAMMAGEDECYIAVEKTKGHGMEMCIAGDEQQILIALIRLARRLSEKCGVPGGAYASLMAAADVSKMMEEETK